MELNRVIVVVRPVPERVRGCRRYRTGRLSSVNLRAEHADAICRITRDLDDIGIGYRVVSRYNLRSTSGHDLIISVGGDGTFLAAAHKSEGIPLLGVNPAPRSSVGFFCISKAGDFRRTIERVIAGRLKPTEVPLIETRIGTEKLPLLALNDVLFAGRSPAETVRYRLTVGGATEDQKSSGVWIAAGPGSTAAIGSAGGKRQPIASKRLQYLVREPYSVPGQRYGHTKGLLKVGETVAIKSAMGNGMVYVDGHRHFYPVPWKSRVTCRISKSSLKIFV